MCQLHHQNFFHNCGHVQTVTKPSSNPTCDFPIPTIFYVRDNDAHRNPGGGWCDRCFQGPLLSSLHYEIELAAQRCLLLSSLGKDSGKDKVKATVTLGPVPFRRYAGLDGDEDELWARRRDAVVDWSDYRHWDERLQKEVQRARERPRMGNQGLKRMERTYFLVALPHLRAPDEDLYVEIRPEKLEEDEGDCGICGFSMLEGSGVGEEKKGEGERKEIERCTGGHPALMPCGHVFGVECIRSWVEGKQQNTCPMCKEEWKIVREEQVYPEGWQEEYGRYLHLLEHPLDWYEEPLRHWQFRLGLYILSMAILALIFTPPPWTNCWTILTLTAGTTTYYYATTVPVKMLSEVVFGSVAWAGYTVQFLKWVCFGVEEFEWSFGALVVLGGAVWLAGRAGGRILGYVE